MVGAATYCLIMPNSTQHSFVIVNGELIAYRGINETIVLVPHGVETIGESAFGQGNSESIKIIILPETVVNIDKYAFMGCANLRYINFPTSLRKIGLRPFNNPEYLKHLYIPDEVMECDVLGYGMRLETLRLPLHLFNEMDRILPNNLHTLILGLPEEDGMTCSQDKVDFHKIEHLHSSPCIILEQYVSSHLSRDIQFSNHIFTVDGCMLFCDLNGRDYVPNKDSEFGFTYVVSIPEKSCVVPSKANVLDSKCGWHNVAPVLYIPPTIEFIAPDAFRRDVRFVTPASNESNLKQILSKVKFNFKIVTI